MKLLLQAQLRGKLTVEEERMEDLLTSNVFGSIKYLKPEEGLLPILQSTVARAKEDVRQTRLSAETLFYLSLEY